MILNLYMPVFDETNKNINEFSDILDEASAIVNSYHESKIILGGGF